MPLLEALLANSEDEAAAKAKEAIDMFKPVLSKETFNILQLLGFNFKQAIGEPLTLLVNKLISSKIPLSLHKSAEYQILLQQRELEFLKVVQDEDAFQRYLRLIGAQTN